MTVRAVGVQRVASSIDALDRILDEIAEDAAEPVLVRLAGGGATLSIGLGHPGASVALYHDPHGRPWHAEGDEDLVENNLSFGADTGVFGFFAEAAMSIATVRRLAREFAESPGRKPPGGNWKLEGE